MQMHFQRQYIPAAVAIGIGLESWFLSGNANGYSAATFQIGTSANAGGLEMSFYSPSTWLDHLAVIYTWTGISAIVFVFALIVLKGRFSQITCFISALVTASLSFYGFYLFRSPGSVENFSTSSPLVVLSMALVLIIFCILDLFLDRSNSSKAVIDG
jgi:hypothetical protein